MIRKGIMVLAVVVITTMSANADEIIQLNHPDRLPYDFNKTGKSDTQLCWAYSILNSLIYANQSFSIDDMKYLLKKMHDEYGDTPQEISNIVEWLFKKVFELGDRELWFSFDYVVDPSPSIIRWIAGALLQDEVIMVALYTEPARGHGVTCYGYKYERGYHYLRIADNDDGKTQVNWIQVYLKDNRWVLSTYPSMWIDSAYSLKVID